MLNFITIEFDPAGSKSSYVLVDALGAVRVPQGARQLVALPMVCLSATRAQARTIFGYCLGFLEASPLLDAKIMGVTADEIRLAGNISISTHPNSFRSVRGRTLLACIFDEIAFWMDEDSANPDVEVLRACLPSLATSGGKLIGISSPYRKAGLLYERHKNYFGRDGDNILVVQAASRVLNPTLAASIITRAERDDPEAASAEWGAEFRSDISTFLDDLVIQRAVDVDRPLELEPRRWFRYWAFADASGGRSDSYVLAIAHKENNHFVVDCVRSRQPPFDPYHVTCELAYVAKSYGCRMVYGDNYSAEWTQQAWRDQGLHYERADMPASKLYEEMLPAFTREQIRIPNHAALIKELRSLERRTSRMGRDLISHVPGGHDDHANALAGVVRQIAVGHDRVMRCEPFPFLQKDKANDFKTLTTEGMLQQIRAARNGK